MHSSSRMDAMAARLWLLCSSMRALRVQRYMHARGLQRYGAAHASRGIRYGAAHASRGIRYGAAHASRGLERYGATRGLAAAPMDLLPPAPRVALKEVSSTDMGYLRFAFDQWDAVIIAMDPAAPRWDAVPYGDVVATRLERREAAAKSKQCGASPATELPNDLGTRVAAAPRAPLRRARDAGAALEAACAGLGAARRVALVAPRLDEALRPRVRDAVLAAATAAYEPRPKPEEETLELTLVGVGERTAREAAADEAAALARYLAALPPNVLTPGAFREALRRVAEAEGFAYDELDVDGLAAAGCGAFLSVVRGSPRRDAALVRLSKGPASARPLVLVGKGVTFDTGGYNVKGASGMKGMKGDMAGAAAAVGAAVALSRLGVGGEASPLPLEVWLCVADNLISPDAFYPDEVVTACDGTTVEIVHTDAEGRMVLADALALASRKCLESGQADHIYAASFLERFVADDVPWIHLDLAAASTSKGLAHVRTGPATGFGVRAVVGLVLDHWDEIARS
ncbi:manganese ion binding protein [Aureococcus anophagefferens]|nr:manganese ion binding protein [Aureococcus anophagefferens]